MTYPHAKRIAIAPEISGVPVTRNFLREEDEHQVVRMPAPFECIVLSPGGYEEPRAVITASPFSLRSATDVEISANFSQQRFAHSRNRILWNIFVSTGTVLNRDAWCAVRGT